MKRPAPWWDGWHLVVYAIVCALAAWLTGSAWFVLLLFAGWVLSIERTGRRR